MATVRKRKLPAGQGLKGGVMQHRGRGCGELIFQLLSLSWSLLSILPWLPAQDQLSENLLGCLCLPLPTTALVGKEIFGLKGVWRRRPQCLHEAWRKEERMEERRGEGRSSKPCIWNLLIFHDPELSEGGGSSLWAMPGSVKETE